MGQNTRNCRKFQHAVEATETRGVREESNISKEICQFMKSKGKDSAVSQDQEWQCELAFLADVTAHLNFLNLQLLGHSQMISDMW